MGTVETGSPVGCRYAGRSGGHEPADIYAPLSSADGIHGDQMADGTTSRLDPRTAGDDRPRHRADRLSHRLWHRVVAAIAFSESVPDLALGLSSGVPGSLSIGEMRFAATKSGSGIAGHPK